jgi:hypothetical protein
MKRNYHAHLIVALLGITLMTASVSAQNPQYKVGDRVEVNMVPGPDKSMAVWKKGTITGVFPDPTVRAYVVQLDPLPGQAPREMTIPISNEVNGDIRPFGGAAPQIQTDKLRVDDNGTVLADRELLDCENLKHDGRNGAPPPVELAKKLIRCLYEKPSKPGMDGATTMDISALTIGAPHRWTVYVDMGQGEPNTLVYPVQVKWTMKTFYRRTNMLTTDKEGPFTCFADATNVWQCGSSTGSRKDGKTQEIVVKP